MSRDQDIVYNCLGNRSDVPSITYHAAAAQDVNFNKTCMLPVHQGAKILLQNFTLAGRSLTP